MRLAVHMAVAGTLLASPLYGAGGAQAASCRFVKFATLGLSLRQFCWPRTGRVG